jgi:hypothetical protein
MKPFWCDQYSDEWWKLHRALPSASDFDSILTPTGKLSAQADGYICRLLGDKYDLYYPRKNEFATAAMRHGLSAEPESRKFYELERSCDVKQVGLCISDDGRLCCSPDGLVGEDGLLELKNPSPAVHVKYLLAGVLPSEYGPQVHGQLVVTGRKWADFLSYCPGLPPLLIRVVPGEYTELLRAALGLFLARYDQLGDLLGKLNHSKH